MPTDSNRTTEAANAQPGDNDPAGSALRCAMPARVFAFLLLLLLPHTLPAARDIAPDLPRFASVGPDLPSSVVTSLAEDSTGFIWMGTARGLVRFDGHRFRLYGDAWSTPPEETSLFVRSLLADDEGGLWVGTDFAGLARYEPASDRLLPVDTGAAMPPSYSVNTLVTDRQGRLWIGTDDQGVLMLQGDGRMQRFNHGDGSGLPDNRVEALLIDQAGTLWLGSWGGLARKPADATAFAAVALDHPAPRITALLQDDDGQIWIGSRDGRLWRIAADDAAAMPQPLPDAGNSAIYALMRAGPDRIWAGRASGVEIRAADDGRLLHQLHHQSGNPASLASGEVRALLRDRGEQTWVGSYAGGVRRHNSRTSAFRLRDRHDFAGVDDAPEDLSVRAIVALSDGRILLGTQERGIAMLDAALRPQGVLRDPQGQALLRGVRITGLAQTTDGALWIGSDAGLFRQAAGSPDLLAFPLETGRTRRLLADPRGDLWIAAEDGLWRHRPGAQALERKSGDPATPLRGDINALDLDARNRLWIGSESGLALLDHPDAQPRRIEAAHPARGHNPDVLGLLVDDDGAVWFDTPSGLFHLRLEADGTETVEAVSRAHGLAGQPFGANLLRDAQGRLWTQSHVLDPALGQVMQLAPSDGVELGSPWFRAFAQTQDGILLFGGTQGVVAVLPEQFQFAHHAPPLAITDLRIDGISTPQARGADGVELVPGQRSLAIEFAALDFNAAGRIQYAYRLVGESDDWTTTSADYRVATFANLAPGEYRFELRAGHHAGQSEDQMLALPLRVRPAWWQTWWARLAGVALLIVLVHALIHQRTRWLRRRQHDLEQHVTERTRELQDVSIALREKSRALEEASRTDPLTGLRNRRYFAAHIDADVAQSLQRHEAANAEGRSATQADLLFFMVDIDHFKQVNDEYGHAAGDAVLMQLAQRLHDCFRDSDHLVRWGGEEFLVVARHATRRHAAELADRVVQTIANRAFELPDRRQLYRTCSLGQASFPLQTAFPRQTRWSEVAELADLALYAAKRAGRNGWAGIHAAGPEPLPLDWRRQLPALLDSGQLQLSGSLPLDAMRNALDEGID